ncbi:MAG: hypothetical protein MI723_04530, partial [Caulobacterales bacterium]|nr:hypothetical protein [Caulobacterales bacterium]
MADESDRPSDQARRAARDAWDAWAAWDAWDAWAHQPHMSEDWKKEGEALWEAAYAALDFSWEGLA